MEKKRRKKEREREREGERGRELPHCDVKYAAHRNCARISHAYLSGISSCYVMSCLRQEAASCSKSLMISCRMRIMFSPIQRRGLHIALALLVLETLIIAPYVIRLNINARYDDIFAKPRNNLIDLRDFLLITRR